MLRHRTNRGPHNHSSGQHRALDATKKFAYCGRFALWPMDGHISVAPSQCASVNGLNRKASIFAVDVALKKKTMFGTFV